MKMNRKFAVIVLAFCFIVPTIAQAQSPVSTYAKAGWLCRILPITGLCGDSGDVEKQARFKRGGRAFDANYEANARFKRGARSFGATPVEVVPAD